MAYLLDSNIFIQAKNEYYGFDLCPGFWEWLEQQNAAGKVFSIDRVQEELVSYADALSQWAKKQGHVFFLATFVLPSQTYQDVPIYTAQFPSSTCKDLGSF